LLRRQAKNLETFNGNLLAWVKTFDPVYRQKFSDSFENLLHRQVALLKNFERVLTQDGMQTPLFLASCEDLLRRQAQSLEGFGDLGQFTFDATQAQGGPGIAIYKTVDKTSASCQYMSNHVRKPIVLFRYMRLFQRIHLRQRSRRRISRKPR
jgi:hypothetical protein